jgi:hypothetical protein
MINLNNMTESIDTRQDLQTLSDEAETLVQRLRSTRNQTAPSKRLSLPKQTLPKSQRQPVDLGPKFNALKRFLSYFNGAAICTGIGLYSYYKCSPEQWYRPILIGLSILGGTTCSFLTYKNLK